MKKIVLSANKYLTVLMIAIPQLFFHANCIAQGKNMSSNLNESKKYVSLIQELEENSITDDRKWKELDSAKKNDDLKAVEEIRKELIAKYNLGSSPVRHSIFLNQPADCPSCTHFFGDGFHTIISGDLKMTVTITECDIHKVTEHDENFSDEQLEILRLLFDGRY